MTHGNYYAFVERKAFACLAFQLQYKIWRTSEEKIFEPQGRDTRKERQVSRGFSIIREWPKKPLSGVRQYSWFILGHEKNCITTYSCYLDFTVLLECFQKMSTKYFSTVERPVWMDQMVYFLCKIWILKWKKMWVECLGAAAAWQSSYCFQGKSSAASPPLCRPHLRTAGGSALLRGTTFSNLVLDDPHKETSENKKANFF